ncbi:hypothetical protein ACH61_02378 [Rathayibacter tanaceti]|uniref:Uncharacterized protein n=1 Tax=Rathayibacter tanaceti TaxID=1671680 RepID=A0A162GFX8_9MICO|nr:hypothetical protein ACH61_02378 [Rathayibacter tanaceti]
MHAQPAGRDERVAQVDEVLDRLARGDEGAEQGVVARRDPRLREAGVDERARSDHAIGRGAARDEAALLLGGDDADTGAEEVDDARLRQCEQLVEAVRGRAAREEAEPAEPPAVQIFDARPRRPLGRGGEVGEEEVAAQHREEQAHCGAVLLTGAQGEVAPDVGAHRLLHRGRVLEPGAGQRTVEVGEEEPVGLVGHGLGDQRRERPRIVEDPRGVGPECRDGVALRGLETGPAGGGEHRCARIEPRERLREPRPVGAHPLGVAGEQLAVVAPEQLLGDRRPDVLGEVEGSAARAQPIGDGGGEPAELGRRPLQGRTDLGVVRHAAAAADHDPRLSARRQVPQGTGLIALETAAPALGEQHHQVDGHESEAAHDHIPARGQSAEVRVGGKRRREVVEAVPRGESGQARLLLRRQRAAVTEREQHEIGGERVAGVEDDQLPAVVVADDLGGARPVLSDLDVRSERGDRLPVEPAEVEALQPASGEAVASEPVDLAADGGVSGVEDHLAGAHGLRPLDQRRAGAYGALDRRARVGEHRDVGGERVELQQRRLLVAPDAAGADRERIDEVDDEPPGAELGSVRGEPFEHAHRPRSTADDHEGSDLLRCCHDSTLRESARPRRGTTPSGSLCDGR